MRPTNERDCAGSSTSASSARPIFSSAAKVGSASKTLAPRVARKLAVFMLFPLVFESVFQGRLSPAGRSSCCRGGTISSSSLFAFLFRQVEGGDADKAFLQHQQMLPHR